MPIVISVIRQHGARIMALAALITVATVAVAYATIPARYLAKTVLTYTPNSEDHALSIDMFQRVAQAPSTIEAVIKKVAPPSLTQSPRSLEQMISQAFRAEAVQRRDTTRSLLPVLELSVIWDTPHEAQALAAEWANTILATADALRLSGIQGRQPLAESQLKAIREKLDALKNAWLQSTQSGFSDIKTFTQARDIELSQQQTRDELDVQKLRREKELAHQLRLEQLKALWLADHAKRGSALAQMQTDQFSERQQAEAKGKAELEALRIEQAARKAKLESQHALGYLSHQREITRQQTYDQFDAKAGAALNQESKQQVLRALLGVLDGQTDPLLHGLFAAELAAQADAIQTHLKHLEQALQTTPPRLGREFVWLSFKVAAQELNPLWLDLTQQRENLRIRQGLIESARAKLASAFAAISQPTVTAQAKQQALTAYLEALAILNDNSHAATSRLQADSDQLKAQALAAASLLQSQRAEWLRLDQAVADAQRAVDDIAAKMADEWLRATQTLDRTLKNLDLTHEAAVEIRKQRDESELAALAARHEQELADLKAQNILAVEELAGRLKAQRDGKKAGFEAQIDLRKNQLELEQRLTQQQLDQQGLAFKQASQALQDAEELRVKTINEMRISAPAATPQDAQPRNITWLGLSVAFASVLSLLLIAVAWRWLVAAPL